MAHMKRSTNFSSSEAAWCITATVIAAASYLSSGRPSLSNLQLEIKSKKKRKKKKKLTTKGLAGQPLSQLVRVQGAVELFQPVEQLSLGTELSPGSLKEEILSHQHATHEVINLHPHI